MTSERDDERFDVLGIGRDDVIAILRQQRDSRIDHVSPLGNGEQLTGRTAKGGVQGSNIDADERLREQRLARAAFTPRLTDDTTV